MPSPVQFRFEPEWRITLFTLVLVPVMVGLGFWQLQRAGEKAVLADSFERRQLQAPASPGELADLPGSALAYRPARIDGTPLAEEYFLLDNRIQGGRFGYEVLAVVLLDDGSGAVLLNRGWIAGDAARQSLPRVPPMPERVSVTGHVYVPPGKPYLLAEQRLEPGWPKLLQAVEMDLLAPELEDLGGAVALPYSVRIDSGQPGALGVDWQVVNISPQKHQGYAVQWFTMAGVLLVVYMLRCTNLWALFRGRHGTED